MEKHFASLKLLDTDTDWKLTRTVSYSKLPSSHETIIKETYRTNDKFNLVRQYSCGQIFEKRANASQLQALETCQTDDEIYNNERRRNSFSNEFKSVNWRFNASNNILKAPKLIPKRTANEIERENVSAVNSSKFLTHSPDVDTDVEDKRNRVSYTETDIHGKVNTEIKRDNAKEENKGTYEDIKKKMRPLVVKKKSPTNRKVNMYYLVCLTVCIIPAVTVILSLFLNMETQAICNHEQLFANASLELQQRIHGQESAISSIVNFFNEDYTGFKVLCVIGGTGVGKSYTAEIVRKNFPLNNDVYVYDAMLDHSININTLNSLGTQRLFIAENLKMKNLNMFGDIIDILKETKDKCTTVLAIFNVEEVNDSLERKVDLIQSRDAISHEMASKNVDMLIVPYEPLNEGTLEICIAEAALTSGFTLTNDQMNEIKESLILSESGCKKAYSKVQISSRY